MTQHTLDAVTAKEKQKWESWSKNDTDFFKSSLEVKDYSINDIQVVTLSEDTALVTYRATQHYTYKGQEVENNVVASSIWVNRGSEWVNILHQETPVQHQ